MSDLFNYLAAIDDSEHLAKRKAVVASTHRVTDKLGAFLANANSDSERASRFELVHDDVKAIVESACREFGVDDHELVEKAIIRHFAGSSNTREASTKESVRRPRMCPYHKQIVDISLAQGEPKAGYDAMSSHAWSKQHCESDEYGGDKCKFKPEMTTTSYWEDRTQRNQEKREERERTQEEPFEETHDISDSSTEPIADSEPTEVSDSGSDSGLNHDLESAPSAVAAPAVAAPEHEARVAAPQQYPGAGQAQVGNPPQQQPQLQAFDQLQQQQPQQHPQLTPQQIQQMGQAGTPLGQQQAPQAPVQQVPNPQYPPVDPNQQYQQYGYQASVHTAGSYTVEQLSDGSGRWKVVGPGGTSQGIYDTQQEAQAEANQLNRGVSNQNQAELAPVAARVADSGNDNLGGPSPKMDKRKWTPENVKTVDADDPNGRNPTKQVDPLRILPDEKSDDFLEGTRALTETQSVTQTWKNPGSGATKTFDGTGQANPVTSSDNPLKQIMSSDGFLSSTVISSALADYTKE